MVQIHHQRWFRRELHTRLPFHYGIAVMERVPHVWLELEATIDGERVSGRSADHLPPKWFTKDPARTLADEWAEMYAVLQSASAAFSGGRAGTVHRLVRTASHAQAAKAGREGWPPLLANFGISLVERALIDAFCRRYRRTIAEVLRGNGLGIRLRDLHPELAGMEPADGLPRGPLPRVRARHTVGLADPLEADEVDHDPADGLPVDLREVIRRYGVREFKIKVAGESALERLERVVTVIESECGADYAATLDGNEWFTDVAALRSFWQAAQSSDRLRGFWPRLRFFEQPLHRDVALGDEVASALPQWIDRPALLIDESGGRAEDLRRALDIGYIGVSHKNCKGVIHGVANRCLLSARGGNGQMSGEDLSNVGPVALLQDLAVQAALGNESVERNGHHYFAGLSGWPPKLQENALRTYPELYAKNEQYERAELRINAGWLETKSVVRDAFGGPWNLGLDGAGECWAEIG